MGGDESARGEGRSVAAASSIHEIGVRHLGKHLPVAEASRRVPPPPVSLAARLGATSCGAVAAQAHVAEWPRVLQRGKSSIVALDPQLEKSAQVVNGTKLDHMLGGGESVSR